MNDYPVKGWLIGDVSNAFLIDRDFRGGNNFSFAGKQMFPQGSPRLSNYMGRPTGGYAIEDKFSGVDGPTAQNPLAQSAFETGASIADIYFAYQKSGSQEPLLQWLQRPEVKAMLQQVVKSGQTFEQYYNNGGQMPTPSNPSANIPTPPAADITIWGMSPITFGIVTIAAVLGISASAFFIAKGIKNSNATKALKNIKAA